MEKLLLLLFTLEAFVHLIEKIRISKKQNKILPIDSDKIYVFFLDIGIIILYRIG